MINFDTMIMNEIQFRITFEEIIESESLTEKEKEKVEKIYRIYLRGFITPHEAVDMVEKALFW